MTKGRYACLLSSACALTTLIILLVLVYAVAPAVVRSQLSGSTLRFDELTLVGVPTNTSAHTQATATIGHVLNMPVRMASTQLTLSQVVPSNASGVGVRGSDSLMLLGTLTLPSLHVRGPTSFVIDSNLSIASADHFAQFAHYMLRAKEVQIRVHGDVSVTPHLGAIALPTQHGIAYDKTVTLAGCDGLRDVQLVAFSLRNSSESQLLVDATIALHNPSPFALHPIGQLRFDLFYRGLLQGSLRTLDADTRMDPGTNLLNFTGQLSPDLQHIDVTNELISLYLTGQGATVQAQPAAEGASSIPLYDSALQGLVLDTFLPGLANGSLITQLQLIGGSMTPSTTDQSVDLLMDLQFAIDSPVGPRGLMQLSTMALDVTINFINHTTDGAGKPTVVLLPIGTLRMDAPIALQQVSLFVYRVSLAHTMQLLSPVTNFQQFVGEFVRSSGLVGLQFLGTADVQAKYLYGDIVVAGVPVQNSMYMQGAGGFNQTHAESLIVHDNRDNCSRTDGLCGVYVDVFTSLFNPASLTLNLSSPWFDLMSPAPTSSPPGAVGGGGNVRLGSLQMDHLIVLPGLNSHVKATGFLDPAPQDLPALSALIGEYVRGINHTLTIQGLTYDPSAQVAQRSAEGAAAAGADDPPMSAHQLVLSMITVPAGLAGIEVDSLLGSMLIHLFQFDFADGDEASEEVRHAAAAAVGAVADAGPPYTLATAASLDAQIVLPASLAQMPLRIESTGGALSVLYDMSSSSSSSSSSVDGSAPAGLQSLGSMSLPADTPVSYLPGSNNTVLQLSFSGASFAVSTPDEVEAFQSFGAQVLSAPNVSLVLAGSVSPVASTNLGVLELEGVPVRQSVSLVGFNSFRTLDGLNSLVHVEHLDILGATVGPTRAQGGPYLGGGSIDLKCNVSLTNPSAIALRDLGVIEFDVWFEGVRILTVELRNVSIATGTNVYDESCFGTVHSPTLSSPTDAAGLRAMVSTQKFISDYLDGFPNDFVMMGKVLQADGSYRPGTSIPLLQQAFAQFNTNLTVTGQPRAFITSLEVVLTIESAAKLLADKGGILPAMAQLYNPFSTGLTITHLNLTVLAGNYSAPVGGWIVPVVGMQPIYVPALSTLKSSPMAVYLQLTDTVLALLMQVLFGPTHSADVSARGEMVVWIGTSGAGQPDPRVIFNQTVTAAQENVPVTLASKTLTGEPITHMDLTTPPPPEHMEAYTQVMQYIAQHHPDPVASAAALAVIGSLPNSHTSHSTPQRT